jgi:thiamine biosynthesis lipoprotein
MGTTLHVGVLALDRAEGVAAIEDAFAAVRRADSLLSTWRDDSEISRLNHAPTGRPVRLSSELYALLQESQRWSAATGGAFEPAVGALVDAWDLRGRGRIPSPVELAAARSRTGMALFRFTDANASVTRRCPGAWIDTGGFGKGVALRVARAALQERGIASAFLNFGGQVLAIGADRGSDWVVPVAHPARRLDEAARLRLRNRSASTSSQSERFLDAAGRRLGHVLDPRSGRPVPAWGSVTVVAEDPALADALSTALLVLGPDAALAWAESRDDVGVLVLEVDAGRPAARWNRGLARFLVTETEPHRGG